MKIIYATPSEPLILGRKGENNARQIVFSVDGFVEAYGPGTVELVARRTGDTDPYPVAITVDGTNAVWTVSAADTAIAGRNGKAELRYYVGDMLVKSAIWRAIVYDALGDASPEPPEPQQGWVDQVLAAGAAIQQAAAHAPTIGDNGNWFVWDAATGAYVDTGRYSGGSAPYIGANGNWYVGNVDTGVNAEGKSFSGTFSIGEDGHLYLAETD